MSSRLLISRASTVVQTLGGAPFAVDVTDRVRPLIRSGTTRIPSGANRCPAAGTGTRSTAAGSTLTDCPNGIVDWIQMFGAQLVAHVPERELPSVLARAAELAAPTLRKPDGWYADYWRLRFVAVAESSTPND